MQKLVAGVHQFQRDIFSSERELWERMARTQQQPDTLFICCSDSRVVPSLITRAKPGEMFELQNAGNIVPAYGATGGGEAATVEYAVAVLKVKDIVVCGHSHCGAMKALISPPEAIDGLTAVQRWLNHAEATKRILRENYTHLSDDAERLTAAVEENVLVQLEHLRTHPAVAAALARSELHLHGWVYKIETGQVFVFEPESGQFVGLEALDPA